MRKMKFGSIIAIIISILIAIAVANGAFSQPAHAQHQTAAIAPTQPTRFTAEVVGQGPDVILIPGLSTPRDVWQPTADALKARYRVHLIQVRGFGDAVGANASGPVLDPFVEELADYISANKLKQPAIIGHSMGGLAALMISARHPDLPGKIMVVDAVPFIGTIFNPAATVDMVRPQAERMKQMMIAAADQAAKAPTSAPVSAPGNMSNTTEGRAQIAKWMQASDARVVAQAMYDDMVTDMRPELGKITAPVTLLYAQDDRAMTPERATAAFVPQYKGVAKFAAIMVPGSFHFIMLDQPARFVSEVEAFLRR